MEQAQVALILTGFGFAALGATLMAALKMWHGWLDLKKSELAVRSPLPGEERVDIAELRARVRRLESIAACVDP